MAANLTNTFMASDNDNVENSNRLGAPHNMDHIVDIYTSLIQQYLSVMCVENAIFLAERFVATKKSNDSQYLLALCYYRSGSPKRALAVLQLCHELSPKIQYLVAKCCFELGDYGRAEDALLQFSRQEYRRTRGTAIPPTESNIASEAIDYWIVNTTVSFFFMDSSLNLQ